MNGETIIGIDYGVLKTSLLVVFFVIFTGIVLRLVLSRSNRYREAARLPLDDGPAGRNAATGDPVRSQGDGGE